MVEAPTGRYMIAVAKSANSEISTELVRDAAEAINAADFVFTQFEISPEGVVENGQVMLPLQKAAGAICVSGWSTVTHAGGRNLSHCALDPGSARSG